MGGCYIISTLLVAGVVECVVTHDVLRLSRVSPPSAGEWQTQLSRHQLRVLKQKQKQEREQEREGKPPTQPPTEEEAPTTEQRATLTSLSEKEESGESPTGPPERSDSRSELPEVGGSVSDVEKALKDAS